MNKIEVIHNASAKAADKELVKSEAQLLRKDLQPEDLQALYGEKKYANIEEYRLNRSDIFIERLQESLRSPNMTVDDV